jgi:hypothetical protein
MPTLRIEHVIRDYDLWKAAFDRDPGGRERSGVRRYRISRPIDDPNYVIIDLDFDDATAAEAFAAAMIVVWDQRAAALVLTGGVRTRITDAVESHQF